MHQPLAHLWQPSLSWVCTTPSPTNPLIYKLCFKRVDGPRPSTLSQHAWLSALEFSGETSLMAVFFSVCSAYMRFSLLF
jgi:hypothetical protein